MNTYRVVISTKRMKKKGLRIVAMNPQEAEIKASLNMPKGYAIDYTEFWYKKHRK